MKINWLFRFIVLLSGLAVSSASQAAISDSLVQEALKALYTSTAGPSWSSPTGWTSDPGIEILCPDPVAVPEIITHGVVCDGNDNVVELVLNDNNLVGTIPAEIGNLSNLVRLKLQNNKLNGNIPSELGLLSKLVELRLFNNELEGSIPESLTDLTNLLYLDLYDNQLSGQLPVGLGKLTRLWYFYINGNKFIGDLPSDLINMGSISTDRLYLDLNWNAVISQDATLNSFINANHINLTSYEDSQTLAPTSVSILSKTPTSVQLQWSDFDTSPSTTGGYKVLRATSLGGEFKQVGPDIDNRSVTTTTINNLEPGTNYWFKVCNYTDSHIDNPKNMVVSIDSVAVSKGVPAVSAGVVQTVNELTTVNLSSSASDTDGTIVGYSWSQLSGATVVLTGANSAAASFTAPEVTSSGDVLTFRITVTDNDGDIAYDDVQVTVNDTNPTVSAGLDQTVNEGNAVLLTATASDPNGSIVSYLWKQDEGPVVTLSGQSTATASFTTPSIDTPSESLLFTVTVTDNDGRIATDSVMVTVNNAPTVTAGIDKIVNEGDSVSLSAIASDGGENAVNYLWTQVSGPAVDIIGSTTASASFIAPLVDASIDLNFIITVTDIHGATANDTVLVTVNNLLIPPTVYAGDDQIADEFAAVNLSATADDVNGSIVSYSWRQISGTVVTLSATNTASVSFNAPQAVDPAETLIFEVSVRDNDYESATDQVQVTVNDVIIPPEVETTTDLPGDEVEEQSWIVLVADAYDLDGEIVSYYWEQVSGTEVTLESTDTATTRFQAPNISGNRSIRLLFKVTVTDDDGETDTSLKYVIITKKKVIVAGSGALSWLWLLLMGMPLLGRRFLK